jgi:hypothetical protein
MVLDKQIRIKIITKNENDYISEIHVAVPLPLMVWKGNPGETCDKLPI